MLTTFFAAVLAVLSIAVPPDVDLSDENLDTWHQHIRPSESELAWATIPWHDTFAGGMRAASDAGKPMLFWAMNGHPMGCT